MTVQNRKSAATKVDVYPNGRVLKREGDFALVEDDANKASWYCLTPVPTELPETEKLPKGVRVIRQVDTAFQIDDGAGGVNWVKVCQPLDLSKLKSYFQVMKVQHTPLIMNPLAVLVQYRRDKSTEWVRNVQVAEKPAKKIFKIEGPKSERFKQIEAGKAMADGELVTA